ncbi:MAG: gamma-glutamyltransferase family protein [Rhodospirillales bacterium]
MRDLQLSGRSAARAPTAMAATSHPLATFAALDLLKRGGNAVDAAIAACAVQCVVEPHMTGIGGDCFAMYAPAGAAAPTAYNGSGRAPAGTDAAALRAGGLKEIPRRSAAAVTVPGAVEAWFRLSADHGRLGMDAVLEAAVGYAENGYPVADRTARDWAGQAEMLAQDPHAPKVFLPGGRAPGAGERHAQPTLAKTLRAIAQDGPAAFYEGAAAEDIIAALKSVGGAHTLDDLAGHAGEYVTPVSTVFRGRTVYEIPPNGQGVIALLMMNALERIDLSGAAPLQPERLHAFAEIGRMAYADRDACVGDPAPGSAGGPVPVDALLSAERAGAMAAAFDPARAGAVPPPVTGAPNHPHTVYLCVVDGDGNAVSFINSLFDGFGSCIYAPESGVMLHSRGCGFTLREGHVNELAPGRRPMHTIIPGMVFENGRCAMPFGVMGGHYQAFGHAWVLSNLFDFDFDVQEAVDLARLFAEPGGPLMCERGISAAAVKALRALGHDAQEAEAPIGGAQMIHIDHKQGVLTGASERRKDGCAAGY